MEADIVERLAYWRDLPRGTPLPDGEHNGWDKLIRAVCVDAIIEIERLRVVEDQLRRVAGAIETSPAFRDVKDKLEEQGRV